MLCVSERGTRPTSRCNSWPPNVKRAVVAVVGNPNSGKTSLFNALTGSKQKVANYPGVTVERVSAELVVEGWHVECIDVPGLYSLEAQSADEQVAVDAIAGVADVKPDLLVCVVNASNLERNLFLFSQLAELETPMVVALTMADVLAKDGLECDRVKLSNLLGVEVVDVLAHRGVGTDALKQAIARNLEEPRIPSRQFGFPESLERQVDSFQERLARVGMDISRREIRSALLSGESPLARDIEPIAELREFLTAAKGELAKEGLDAPSVDVTNRYQWAGQVAKACLVRRSAPKRRLSDRLDFVLTHRVFGLAIFVGVMYGVFQAIYTLASPLMDAIEAGVAFLGDKTGNALEGNEALRSLVVDGIITGIGSVLVFLPQILILFMLIALMEGTGYLARAAFLMDRLLGWCGLNGRAFIPLLSSFACAIPGVMAARVMPDPKSRLATILVAPLMSCSARLPVYVLLIGAFIEPQFGPGWAGFTLFAMHFLGLLLAIPIVLILNKGLIKGRRLPFLLELPPYQLPRLRDVVLAMYFRGKVFLQTAGTIIFVMSVIIWALSYFPRSDREIASLRAEYKRTISGVDKNGGRLPESVVETFTSRTEDQYVEAMLLANSYLGRAGRLIEPVFKPAGFDWRITTAILCAFPAREVVVPSLGVLFAVGSEANEESPDLRTALQHATWPDGRPLMTPWTAIGLMVFFALCAQCMSTLAAVKRETNSWKWPLFMFVYMSALAYLGAVLVNQLGKVFG